MAILRDYKCDKHGFFEAYGPLCKEGCVEGIMAVHLKAPGIKSARTKRTDKNLKGLAQDFDMSNIKSAREGDNQSGYYTRKNKEQPREPQPRDAAIWGGQGGMNLGSVVKGNMFKSVKGEQVGFNPKDAGNLTGPRTASYIPDHQNLQVEK